MQKPLFKLIIALALAVLFSAPPCWAKEEGYCYVVSYSLREKVFFYSPVFTAVVSGEVYSEEEFVADIELIRDIENKYQRYQKRIGLNNADYVTEARVGYRSQAIADKRLKSEIKRYENRNFTIKKTSTFEYKN